MNEYEEDNEDSADRMVASLYDVEQAIGRVETAINERWSEVKTWATVVLVFYLLWSVPGQIWHAKWRYALTNGVDSDKVVVEKHPHDCDFLAAPLGEKYCRYEREILTVRRGSLRSSAAPGLSLDVISYDEGRTWTRVGDGSPASAPDYSTVQEVSISWKKIDE